MQDYIRKIIGARVYDVAIESPLDPLPCWAVVATVNDPAGPSVELAVATVQDPNVWACARPAINAKMQASMANSARISGMRPAQSLHLRHPAAAPRIRRCSVLRPAR